MFFFRWIIAGLIVRSADRVAPRVEQRYPRVSATYNWLGRLAAWGFIGLIALTILWLPIGLVLWMTTK